MTSDRHADSRPRVHLTARAAALSERLAQAAGRTTPAFADRPAVDTSDDLPIGSMAGPYRIEEVIGRGGMAVVYRATGPTGTEVALKVARPDDPLDPQCRERLLLEALLLDGLRHPTIAALRDVGELPDRRPWMALELVDGEPLNERIARGPVPVAEACALLAEIAAALGVAHAAGVVHRDLKPDNVLVRPIDRLPRCKLIDWGVARSRSVPHARITEVGVVSGTPLYMSPEQARGLEVDGRGDIYALGVIAYEMLCGEPPFDAEDSVSVLMLHVGQAPPQPRRLRPDLPAWLDRLILAMLAKEPAARPTVAEIQELVRLAGFVRRSTRSLGDVLAELTSELDEAGVGTVDAA